VPDKHIRNTQAWMHKGKERRHRAAQSIPALRNPLPRVPIGNDSDFPSPWNECLWESSFREPNLHCHVGDLAGKPLQLGVMASKGEKNREGPQSGQGQQFCIAEEANVTQKLPFPEKL